MSKLAKSSLIFSVMTFFSRILGFLRDMVAAYFFGASPGYDAFILAFRIPNLLRRMFAEGAFAQAFVPVLTEYKVKQSPTATQQLMNYVAGNLALVLTIIVAAGIFFAPTVARTFGLGFAENTGQLQLCTTMLRITFPYILFISLVAYAGSILNIHNKFAIPAITPILLNISIITTSIWLSPKLINPEIALAWGVLIAGIIQLLFQLPFLRQIACLPKLQISWQHPGVRKIMLLMLPAIMGAAISQINILIDTIFASFLPVGSISWLYYSDRLMEFPLGVFGVGLATVVLPNLSKQHALGSQATFSKILNWGVQCILLISIPAVLGLYLLAGPLISTLFQSGQFSAHDVLMSRQSLMAYSLAIPSIMLAKIFYSAFCARQDIKTPVKISIITLFSNILLNALLIGPLAHAGLALATSISALLHCLLLMLVFKYKYDFSLALGWHKFIARICLANVAMLIFLINLIPNLANWLTWGIKFKVLWLSFLVIAGAGIYAVVLLISGLKPKSLWLTIA